MRTPQVSSGDWSADLLRSSTGSAKPLLANALMTFMHAPEWQGVLAYDEFTLATMALKPPPWAQTKHNFWTPVAWTEQDDRLATAWLQTVHGITVGTGITAEAVETAARNNSFHPVRDYLGGLRWDGCARVNEFAINYFGAEDTPYVREAGQRFLISAVARIMQAGCKADHMLILEGPQGSFKSSAIKVLGDPWTTDDLEDIGSKDAAMQLCGRWFVEVAELAAMGKPAVEKLKAFVSRSTDMFRPPYGRRVATFPRQCVFIGTTNADAYLQDATGGRRFWPIQCGTINLDALGKDRDQLWAEAVLLYQAGERWWLDTAVADMAALEQEDRFQLDPWQDAIAAFIEKREDVSISEVLGWIKDKVDGSAPGYKQVPDVGQWTQIDQNRAARCLRALGWHQYRPAKSSTENKRPPRRYRPRGSGPG